MPHFRGISVHVTDASGDKLKEYGTRSFARAGTASCYIQSKDNMQFKVTVQYSHPLPPSQPDLAEGATAELRERSSARGEADKVQSGGAAFRDRRCDSSQGDHGFRSGASESAASSAGSSERRWDLMASVYLDGRTKPERRAILHLDRTHPNARKDGKITMSHRWVQTDSGAILQHSWLFKEVGVESMLDKLMIKGEVASEGAICRHDEEDLLHAMSATGVDDEEEMRPVGQITVVLTKVVLGELQAIVNYQAMHREGQQEQVDVYRSPAAGRLSHAFGLGHATPYADSGRPVQTIGYKELSGEDATYAIFRFYYRSEEVLRKFNFKEFHPALDSPEPLKTPTRRRMNDDFASLTPLSILRPSIARRERHTTPASASISCMGPEVGAKTQMSSSTASKMDLSPQIVDSTTKYGLAPNERRVPGVGHQMNERSIWAHRGHGLSGPGLATSKHAPKHLIKALERSASLDKNMLAFETNAAAQDACGIKPVEQPSRGARKRRFDALEEEVVNANVGGPPLSASSSDSGLPDTPATDSRAGLADNPRSSPDLSISSAIDQRARKRFRPGEMSDGIE